MGFWDKLTQPQAVLIAAAVGALGAIIGAFLANLVGQALNARSSSRRQWDDARHRSFARASETFYLLWDSFDVRGRQNLPGDRADAVGSEFLAAYSSAVLIAKDEETTAALDRLLSAAQRLWGDPAADWAAADRACHDAHAGFQRAARAEFGLKEMTPAPYAALPASPPAVNGAP